ncbi:hypothetical protein N658DRAFT_507359 [Parathielavia hyrcaniae]|uniref:Uncharacterized protein n=1 Tax=Parathielavia hyrcaniae TaxID=113614 RepID=A0AAN6Q559_9PEZI|nr:hypothetical protein N658DRAFT_507359 [Parathielavia hyrcaniae]
MSHSFGGYTANPYGVVNTVTSAGSQFNQTFLSSGSPASSSAAKVDNFTSEMRDRQARGKDPYHSGDGSDDGSLTDRESGPGSRLRLGTGRVEKENFARVERRQKAIAFLDNPELLMMYAQSTGESIPAARLHFTKLLCGYDEEAQQSTAYGHHHPTQRRDLHSVNKQRIVRDPRVGS